MATSKIQYPQVSNVVSSLVAKDSTATASIPANAIALIFAMSIINGGGCKSYFAISCAVYNKSDSITVIHDDFDGAITVTSAYSAPSNIITVTNGYNYTAKVNIVCLR